MADQLITVSKVKDIIGGGDMRTDGSLPDELNGRVVDLVSGAMQRCRDNGRSTVRPEDLAGSEATNPLAVTVASRVSDVVRNGGLRVDGNLVDAVNGRVQAMVQEGMGKARANGRATVRPYDLPRVS